MQRKIRSQELSDFVQLLYTTDSFSTAFEALEKQVLSFGFDGLTYTYIPRAILDLNFNIQPTFHVSTGFNSRFLAHYSEAQFEKHDPTIKAVEDGVLVPFDWRSPLFSFYSQEYESKEIFNTAVHYGIHSGVTLPMMSGAQGIAGASVISEDAGSWSKLLAESMDELRTVTRLFHNMVFSNAVHMGEFTRPLLGSLNKTELCFLVGLANGKSPRQLAAELNRSVKYLEQVMLSIRRKFSGTGPDDKPAITRNQLLYYVGLMDFLDLAD